MRARAGIHNQRRAGIHNQWTCDLFCLQVQEHSHNLVLFKLVGYEQLLLESVYIRPTEREST